MVDDDVGGLVNGKGIILIVGTVNVARAETQVTHDDIVRAVDGCGPSSDGYAISGRGLAGQGSGKVC